MFDNLREGYRAAIIGASGGIGRAIKDQLENDPRCDTVYSFARSGAPSTDILSEESLETAANSINAELDALFITTGQLSFSDETGPEKALSHIKTANMSDMLSINAVGPALVLKHFEKKLARKSRCLIACLSARVGSIGDNQLGGWISYRASKAALNQIVRTAAIELKRKNPENICVALHPGTIPTSLSSDLASGRFTHTPEECAINLIGVMNRLTPDLSGEFFDYAGDHIPW